MKKLTPLALLLVLLSALTARGGSPAQNSTPRQTETLASGTQIMEPLTPTPEPEPTSNDAPRVLVAYFSATNNTEGIANHIQSVTGGDIFEIIPETPYSSADLNYNTDCRANREQNDDSARPAIANDSRVDNMEQYDIIFLGYPIWWGQAPKIMYTFLESYDLSGKTIVPFCTSGSSGIGSSAANLESAADSAIWLDGRRFSSGASQSTVKSWVDSLGRTSASANEP